MVTRTRHAMQHTLSCIFRSQQHTAVGKAAHRRMGVTAIQIAADNLVLRKTRTGIETVMNDKVFCFC